MTKIITFSCKNITKEELMRCSFSLNKTEYNALLFMLKNHKAHSISKISGSMKLERTTVQKAMKGLVEKGMANRAQKNLSRGGYVFLYKAEHKEEIKSRMNELARKWYMDVEETINRL